VVNLHLRKQHQSLDNKLLILTIVLTVLGLIAVADASAPQALNIYGDKYYFVKEQLKWGVIGFIILAVTSRLKYTFWRKLATPLFFGSLILLVLVLIPGLSYSALGARRWFSLGEVNFQPSEIVKLALTIYFAKLAESGKKSLAYFLPLAAISGLIMLEPDLGTTIVLCLIGFTQIFAAGIPILHLAGAGGIGILGTVALVLTSSYRKARFLTFLSQSADPLGRDYHIRQILLALGSGSFFGVGLGQGRQKYLFLPEATTDSIFAIIAEEIGFIGCFALLALFAYFIYRGLAIAKNAPDKFSQVLAVGLTAWVGGQIFLNLASMVALVPLTGIPLPFFSYGGSSLVMILTACGILLSISRYSHAKNR
jgi:cell division protein FtsW